MPSKSVSLNGSPRSAPSTPQTLTVRPFPTPASHKTFLRLIVHRAVISSLNLKAGDLCRISARRGDDGSLGTAFPAVIWPSADPHVQRHIALISDNLRHLAGVGFDGKLIVEEYAQGVSGVGKVVVTKVWSEEEAELEDGWKWFLEHIFVESKYIYEGLEFPNVEYKGWKCRFRIEKAIAGDTTVPETRDNDGKADEIEPILAYKMTVSSTIEFSTPRPLPETPVAVPPTHPPPLSKPRFASVGGLGPQISTLKTLLHSSLYNSHHYTNVGLTPPRGILLYGPPGTGKTLLLKAITSETSSNCFFLTGSVVGKYLGESEAAIRALFQEARGKQPAVIIVDEVDSLAPKRGEGDGNEGRIVATLLSEMDGMAHQEGGGEATRLVVVAATNRPNSVDQALRRPGRFDREIEIGIPNADARREILQILVRNLVFPDGALKGEMVKKLAERTHGFVGADLEALVRTAFTSALKRIEDNIEHSGESNENKPILTEDDIEEALKDVRPTAMREIFLEPPKVRWSDIGGLQEVKQRLREAVEWPLTHPEVFSRLGGTPRKGVLLYGPPGCSKTLTAKALATEAGVNFIAVKGPELFNMYLGESERAVREIFRKARAASPSIIFFDEIDALSATREDRGRGGGGGGGGPNVLTTLLNEMDGIEELKGVTILAATNRPELIDPALMRPGRLDTILYVGPPDLEARKEILQIKTRKMSTLGVEIDYLAKELTSGRVKQTAGFSGAEIVNVCDEAIYHAMRESFDIEAVLPRHFDYALRNSKPQITKEMTKAYESWSVGGVRKI